MKRSTFRIFKNASSNIMRGGATALVALVLPHFLTRLLDAPRFAAWALMLQIAAYMNYLDFGLQLAISRSVAQAMDRKDTQAVNANVSTSLVLLGCLSLVALSLIGVILLFIPRIFSGAPVELINEVRLGVAVLTAGAAIALPFSAFTGTLVGIERNDITALGIGGSRIMGAVTVVIAVRHTHSLAVLALCMSVWMVLGGLTQFVGSKLLVVGLRISRHFHNSSMMRELLGFAWTNALSSVCMIVIGGMDLIIVGKFDFNATGPYSIATTLTTFLYGLHAMVGGAVFPPLAVMQQRKDLRGIHFLLSTLTRFTSLTNVLAVLVAYFFGYRVLTFWVGQSYALSALPVLKVLLIANAVRLIAGPFAVGLLATGQQRHTLAGTAAEAVVNLVLSVLGGWKFGPIGVAYGTLLGAFVGVLWIMFLTSRWVEEHLLSAWDLFSYGVIQPLFISGPLVLAAMYCLWTSRYVHSILPIGLTFTVYLSLRLEVFSLHRTASPLIQDPAPN